MTHVPDLSRRSALAWVAAATALGAAFRFYGLGWGAPYFHFHIDEHIVFRYAESTNPNGAMNDIAGIVNEAGNVIGMMPHPENMIEPLHGNSDCRPLFESLLAA